MNQNAVTVPTARRAAGLPLGPLLSAVLLALGCGVEGFEPDKPRGPSELYWDLAVNHHAVTLALRAPYDTLSLAAIPRAATGKPIADLPAPEYTSLDQSKVMVTPDGVLHAVAIAPDPISVVVSLAAANVTHADTVRVRVVDVDVDKPPVMATFSVQPVSPDGVSPDSAKIAVAWSGHPSLAVRAEDAGGIPMSDVLVAFHSSDPVVATIDPVTGVIIPVTPGKVMLDASATVFGVAKADSVLYRIGAPIFIAFFAVGAPEPGAFYSPDFPSMTVGVGAAVIWRGKPSGFRIEFDNAELPNVASATVFSQHGVYSLAPLCNSGDFDCSNAGNIDVAPSSSSFYGAIRVFTAPGVYDYRCPTCGNGGRIIVVDEREP